MSPQNLSQIPLGLPAPTSDGQVRQGAANVEVNYNNTVAAQPLDDGAGKDMFIEMVPYYRGYWIIHAGTIWRTPDAVWTYFQWGVRLCDGAGNAKADLDGVYDNRNYVSCHSAQVWQESCLSTAFKIDMNIVYRCYMWWPNASFGYNQPLFAGPDYHYITGEFIEDGSL